MRKQLKTNRKEFGNKLEEDLDVVVRRTDYGLVSRWREFLGDRQIKPGALYSAVTWVCAASKDAARRLNSLVMDI